MRGRLTLPKDRVELSRIIREHVIREQSRLSYRRIMWLLAYYYLNGMRRFDIFDPRTGTLSPQWLDEEGNMEFQSQEMLSAIDRASARIASMDLRPKVEREGMSLRLIRERSSAQLLLDAMVSSNHLEHVKTQFAHLLTTLGTVGIAGHVTDLPTIGMSADFEVIHPSQGTVPVPLLGQRLHATGRTDPKPDHATVPPEGKVREEDPEEPRSARILAGRSRRPHPGHRGGA